LDAAVVAAGVFYASGAPIWAAIARVGAWINLFNLMPIWQLDGGRGWRALNKRQAWLVVATMSIMLLLTHEYLLLLLIIVAVLRTVSTPEESAEGDLTATTQFIALIGLLSALSRLPVPVP
jgi:Zn-dependent protease